MKTLCLTDTENGKKYTYLTQGKYYDVQPFTAILEYKDKFYLVKDDSGFTHMYRNSNFETLDLVRKRKLKELGI